MYTINDAEIKTAIKATTSAQESGIKRMKVAGKMVFADSEYGTRYQVAIQHKILEDGDNGTVYEVLKTANGKTCAYYNGTFRVAKDGSLGSCYDVSFGSFTNEMAREWLSKVFPEPVEEEEVEETEQVEEETAGVPSEAPAEPETAEMNDYMKKQVLLNVDRLNNVQQEVVCIEGYIDEAYDSIKAMTGSYRFDGVPEDFKEKVLDYRSRLCKLHNEIYDLYTEMEKTCYETRKQVRMS